jgi:DNA processing protein
LLSHLGPPEQIYALGAGGLARHLPQDLARRMAAAPAAGLAAHIERTLRWAGEPGHYILTLADAAYPQPLLAIAGPPLLLYVTGDPAQLSKPGLAVVGARSATPGGMENARAFAQYLAAHGWNVVSGLALGIDAAAHEGALDAGPSGAGTTAVMGTGIDRIYPAANRELAHRVAARGALVTEFELGAQALPGRFPRRNRIVAGLARGVLVVEAARQSGSLITARLAAEAGREVFAIPGSIHSPLSRGCHALIRQGAKLVETAQDIEEEFGIMAPAPAPRARGAAAQSELPLPRKGNDGGDGIADDGASLAGHPLLAALGYDPLSLDELQARSGLDTAALQAQLFELELAGRVARVPDGKFQQQAPR